MRPPRVVESGLAFEPEAHGPAHGAHDANDPVRLLASARVLDRHEVDHFADPLGAEEARQQHVAVGQVHLLVLGVVEAGDLEEASFVLVENRGEDAWRVELRQAAPVDRTVHTHQRDRVQVADDAVGLDRLISHFDTRQERHLGAHSRHSGRESQHMGLPQPRDLVAYPLPDQLPFELGKGQQNIEREPPHAGAGC